ncbi:MAG: hypothetical protein ABIJ39_05920 [Chloroflexota bacterium]
MAPQGANTPPPHPAGGLRTGRCAVLGDALGSVRQLTDVHGTVTYTAAYSPYGEARGWQSAAQTPYGFAGFQDSWADALKDAGMASTFDVSGYWSGPNEIYEFQSCWLDLPDDQNNYDSKRYAHWYDALNDIFK